MTHLTRDDCRICTIIVDQLMTRAVANESNSNSLCDLSFILQFAVFARSSLEAIFCVQPAKKHKSNRMLFHKQSIMQIQKAIPVISTPTKSA